MKKIKLYERGAKCILHNKWGNWEVRPYRHKINPNKIHLAIVSVKADFDSTLPIRMHSSCLFGDAFESLACDCRGQMEQGFKELSKENGVIFYLDHEGRDIGIWNKIKAYALKERGFDTVEANEYLGLPDDNRDYDVVAEILNDMGVSSVKLMTNNPKKIEALKKHGIKVTRVESESKVNKFNKKYLSTKKKKNNHKLK